MARKPYRQKRTGSTAAKDAFSSNGIPLPQGVELRNDDEQVIWDQFTRARSRSDWRDMDLIALAKAVKIEADIRAYQRELDAQGAIVENKRGTQIENPLFRVIDVLVRQQLAIMRSLHLNVTDSKPSTVKAAAVEQDKRQIIRDESEAEGLIAMPERLN